VLDRVGPRCTRRWTVSRTRPETPTIRRQTDLELSQSGWSALHNRREFEILVSVSRRIV
jgi:hypothetical protein